MTAAHGTMAYEVTDACDGWATRQRLAMTITNTDGQDIEMVSDYATWESKDGLSMRFRMRQTTDTAVTEQTEGTATLDSPGGAGSIHYTVPADKTVPMPAGTLFPMRTRSPSSTRRRRARNSSACRSSMGPATMARRTARSSS